MKKIPGGLRVQVFVGTAGLLLVSSLPILIQSAKQKQGHDLFSQEKPEALTAAKEKLQREHRKARQGQ